MTDSISPQRLEQVRDVLTSLPHCRALGMEVVELVSGEGLLRMDYRPDLVGNPDTGHVHGGVVTTVMDTLFGLVAFSSVPEDASVATLDLRIDYLKPAEPREPIFGHARCYKRTRNVLFLSGTAYQSGFEDPIAHCVGTYMVGSVGFQIAAGGKG